MGGSALMTEFTISAVEGFADEVTQLPLVYVFRRHQGGNSNLLNIIPSTDNQIKVTLPAGTSQNTHILLLLLEHCSLHALRQQLLENI